MKPRLWSPLVAILCACGGPIEDIEQVDPLAKEENELASSQSSFWTSNLPATIYNSGSAEQRFLTGDFNGDGRTDIFQTYRGWGSIPTCTSTGSGWSCVNFPAAIYNSGSTEQRFLTGDFNGDGRTDIFQTYRGWSSIPTCTSMGGGWSCANFPATIYNSGSAEQQFLTGDFNGDRRVDVFQTYRGWGSIPTCTSTGSGWSCANFPAAIYNSGSAEQRFLKGDFNGDGRADIFQTYRGWGSIPTCTSTGSGWSCANFPAAIYNSGSAEQQFLTGDFNGDGRTDIFQTYRGWGSIPTCTSTGSGWSCANFPAAIYNSGSAEQRFLTGDFNGDGRTDIVQVYRGWNSYPVCFSTGTDWSCSNIPAVLFNSGSEEQSFLVGDFNGDRRSDLLQTFRGWGSIPISLSL
ncbi:FG-GAP repeat domain-containing protein [Cystobacter fuscus]